MTETTTPLQDLIARAAAADQDIVTSAKNRALVRDMAVALVAQAKLISDFYAAPRYRMDVEHIHHELSGREGEAVVVPRPDAGGEWIRMVRRSPETDNGRGEEV